MDGPAGGSFAVELRRLREGRSFTQEELAGRAGLTVKAVGALERGERTRPYPHTVRSLADALDLDDRERAHLVACVPSRARGALHAVNQQLDPHSRSASDAVAPTSPLFGREADIDQIHELVRSGTHRLVTVTGPGGVGKTRVALEVLSRETARSPHGAIFVDLSSLRDPSLVLQRLAAGLGVAESAGADPVAGLVPALVGRPLLVVLDNFEHLLAAAPPVASLVAHCPDLVVLVTSRAALRVRSEREVVLSPLPTPTDETWEGLLASPCGQLFLDRTAAAGVTWEPDAHVARTIAAICRRLDGLPLAVEIVAAGARLLTPAGLLAHLDERQLDTGPRDLADRQRTMTATLDWSLDLLDTGQVSLFDRLAVFADGFTLDAADAISAGRDDDVIAPLGVLVEHSLVTRMSSPDSEPRFRLLEPIRHYAARRLTSLDEKVTRERHAHYFRDRAVQARERLHGGGLREELDRLHADHANVRAAYLYLLRLDRVADAADLAGGLWLYLALRGHAREGLVWLEGLGSGASDAASCQALTGRMGLLFMMGDITRMRRDAGPAVALARRIEDPGLAAETMTLAGHAAVFAGDLDSADRLIRDALEAAQESGSTWLQAHALVALGQLTLVSGDHDEADRVLANAVDLARELGNPFTLATALTRRATLTALRNDDAATVALLGESISLAADARLSWNLSYGLPALAGVAVRLGAAETAARLFGASASLSADHAIDPRFPLARASADQDLAQVRSQLGEETFRGSWDAGRSASWEELAELASGLTRSALG